MACGCLLVLASRSAQALDKQGSAHGGKAEETEGVDVEGSLSAGLSLYNPTYGARPDNSGLALFRYAGHADVDLIGQKLSIPLDVNLFTDRLVSGAHKLVPTELDLIGGVTTTWPVGPGGLEVGARYERDMPIDRTGFSQAYADVRARYLYSLASLWPRLGDRLADGDISGWLALGVFAYNPSYAARPDNSGNALFRYAPHIELSLLHDILSFGLDATMFTDRETSALRPCELDLTGEIIVHVAPFEVHLAYERDMPLDRHTLIQTYVYALGVWSFDLKHQVEKPMEHRGTIVSP